MEKEISNLHDAKIIILEMLKNRSIEPRTQAMILGVIINEIHNLKKWKQKLNCKES